MKRFPLLFAFAAFVFAGVLNAAADPAAEAEKLKAQQNPYANDLGPSTIPADLLATYSKEAQDAYKTVLQGKCSKCHTAARPLNSQFFEIPGSKDEKAANMAKLKASNPEMFSNKLIWQPETDIWQRYVKRMMSKPGCGITPEEGKAVYKLLVHDSVQRKSGKNAAAWKAHRQKLLDEFKAKNPARYTELYGK